MSDSPTARGQHRSERAFAALLRLFPAAFRRDYTTAALEAFRDRYRDAYRRRGRAGVAVLWARMLPHMVLHGMLERWQEHRPRHPARFPDRPVRLADDLVADIRYAWRSLRRAPAFTTLAIVTLAVGIGATTAIFSVVSGVLLRPLPYPSPGELVAIYTYFRADSGREDPKYAVGSPEYFDYLDQNRAMESVAAVSTETVRLTEGEGDPEFVTAGYVSSSMFTVLGVRPLLGRPLVASDDGAKPVPVFVLSYGLWQRRFGGSPDVIGRTLSVGLDQEIGATGEIVGVMPEGFAFPTPDTQLWTQLPLDPARSWRGGHWFHMIGRLAPGVTRQAADAEMAAMMRAWAVAYPDHHVGHGLFLMPLVDDYVAEARPALLLIFTASALVLLVACANVANLCLARGESRRREMSVRRALGAASGRILRQLLTEGLLLAAVGAALGVTIAWWGVDVLLALDRGGVPRADSIALDLHVLAFAAGLVVLTTLAFGLAPAVQSTAFDVVSAFRGGNRSVTGSERMLARRGLTVVEVALAVMLVTGGGLTTKSFGHLLDVDLGFRPERLLTARFSLPAGEYSARKAVNFYTTLTDAAKSLPGVERAAIVSRPPLYMDRSASIVHIEDVPESLVEGVGLRAGSVMVSPGAFATLGIPLRRGRLLDETDRVDTPLAVVIDEEMARRYWPGRDPIGRRIRFAATDGPWHTIVGVVGNARFDALDKVVPTFYFAQRQAVGWMAFHVRTSSLVLRTNGDPSALGGPLRDLVRALDPKLPIARLQTMDDLMAGQLARPRFLVTLVALFAGVALLLGGVGVYGVMSHGVTRRTNEIGIRMALGAARADVARAVLGEGMRMALLGALAGLALAAAASKLISALLFGVSPTDPAVYGAVATVILAVGFLASYLPARRATRVDPATALRHE